MLTKKKKTGSGILLTASGIVFLLLGSILVLFELMWSINIEWGGMQYTPHLFEYGYQFLGLMMTFCGIAFLISGIYLWQNKYTQKTKGIQSRLRLQR